jgi:NADPH:quinone reductase-like Zn-dependent oxidoreductase
MKALVYTAPDEVTFREGPDPAPAPGEVLLRIDAVGICGTDMHAIRGHDCGRNEATEPTDPARYGYLLENNGNGYRPEQRRRVDTERCCNQT